MKQSHKKPDFLSDMKKHIRWKDIILSIIIILCLAALAFGISVLAVNHIGVDFFKEDSMDAFPGTALEEESEKTEDGLHNTEENIDDQSEDGQEENSDLPDPSAETKDLTEESLEGRDTTKDKSRTPEVQIAPVDDKQDPQPEGLEGLKMDVGTVDKPKHETEKITYGIDVAKWQGIIDWEKVKEAGIDFAMIRIGYRTQVNGSISEDPYAKYNLQQAQKNGIKIGIYFFSTAVNKKEAEEEAAWVTDFIAPYKITYPVAYNCEGYTNENNRQYGMTKEDRTKTAAAFLDFVKNKGYTPMFYAAKNELSGNAEWDTEMLTMKYKIWVAQYPEEFDVEKSTSSYSGRHDMWQYTSQGRIEGIEKPVDLNIAYFGYKEESEAKSEGPKEAVKPDPAALIEFTKVKETVTAKKETNLRSEPGSNSEDTIAAVLHYGDTALRTGIGSNGWSRVEYEGQVLYAVSSYLTTDLHYQDNNIPTREDPEAGITFTEVNETVTAKEITNLRLIPSAQEEDTIVVALKNGETAIRTGIGSNGWSRVEYGGKTLYGVSSYLVIVEATE